MPTIPYSARTFAFIKRILSDFNHQWQHILCRAYNQATLRKVAHAVLSITSLDFKVLEEASRWKHMTMMRGAFMKRGSYVLSWYDYPSWQPCGLDIFRWGNINVVLDLDLEHASELARKHAAEQKAAEAQAHLRFNSSQIYLLLSGRHVALSQIDAQGNLKYTAPALLFNSVDDPDSAVAALLRGSALAFPPPPRTAIHDLPIELQDRILKYVSEGPIEAARLGSLLGIGYPFSWIRMDETRQGGPIERLNSGTHRVPFTPVDSQIWFGETFSGVAYR